MTLCLIAAVLLGAAPEPPEFHAANDELRQYLLEAAENAPELKRLYAEWKAALARIPQATSLDDPELSYTQFVQSDEARFSVGIMQMFPWFGTLRARGEQAAAEADAALARLYAARNLLFQEVKEAYFEYSFLYESIRTTEDQAQLLRDMEDNVSTRYSLGLSSEADLLRVQIEQSQLEDQYNQLLQQRPVLSTRLATALGREAAEDLPWPQDAPLPPPPPPAPVVLARLRLANPALAEADELIRSREKAIDLARKAGRPNITVGLEFQDMKSPDGMPPEWPYMFGVSAARSVLEGDREMLRDMQRETVNEIIADDLMPGEERMKDEIMVGVSVTLPIWRKRVRAGIEEARQMTAAAQAEKRGRVLELDLEAREAVFAMQDALRRYNLYENVLIPRARQTYESLEYKYSAGDPSASFLDVFGSIQTLLNYELEQVRAHRDLQIGAARLERIMGGPWSAGEAAPPPGAETFPAPPAEVSDKPLPDPFAAPEEDSPIP